MARATTKPKKEISMEEALWKSADKLRGAIEPAEYKHVVLSLFFLKFASDKFVKCREKIIKTHGEKYADMKPFYTQENVLSAGGKPLELYYRERKAGRHCFED